MINLLLNKKITKKPYLMEMQFNEDLLIKVFVDVDDFCICHQNWQSAQKVQKVKRLKAGYIPSVDALGHKFLTHDFVSWRSNLSQSEVMTILIYYHHSGYKCFEYYYKRLVRPVFKTYFPQIVGYKYFLSLIGKCFEAIFMFLQWQIKNSEPTGIYYIDSKKLPVCHNKRIHTHQVFKDLAQRGKSSMGWFYGLKVHLVINNLGQIVSFAFSSANFADNNKKMLKYLLKDLQGMCFGDKGYLTKLFEDFYKNGLHLVTKVRKNMKNKLIPIQQKYQLMKRGLIESVNDILMTVCDIEHTRHRHPKNALVHMMTALVAYNYLDNKPAVIFNNIKH